VTDAPPTPLAGLRVIDASTVLAGPACARYLADFGADVIKVERPDGGDSVRRMGWRDPRDGVTLWWKLAARNKRCVALDLKDAGDVDVFLRLCDRAHVLVENFRPGTLERLGLGPEVLLARNPLLVVTRVTGFGQDGPYATKPGFASIAEAMSGFAAVNGEPNGGPLLPPIALTDEVAGLAAAFATMVALHAGVGQVVDVNLLESLFQLMGPLMSAYRLSGYLQPRAGSAIPYSVPRGTFRCADGTWVAISTSADSVAARVMSLLGLADDPRFATFGGRMEHRDELDAIVTAWIGARPADDVVAAFDAAEAAIAPVMTMADVDTDPHVRERGMVADVDGTPMQGLIARLSATPGRLRWTGRPLDADGDEIRAEVDD
jgi:crotonobetainyl-CoA:carnitine CoA-transferase CaiB-like acyl-CoA transferase